MPEAVIVSAARSPIGRANKGSLKDLRPDDLTAQIVRAALDKVPGAGPEHDRRPLPRLRPARRRVRATTWAGSSTCSTGWTTCPAPRSRATAPRRCRPRGWRSTRSRPARATCSSPPASRRCPASPRAPPTTCPDTHNPLFDEAQARTAAMAEGGQDWHDPREDGALPDVYIAMGQTAENVARLRGLTRQELDEFGVRSQNLAEKAIDDGFWASARSPRSPLPDGTVAATDDGPRPGRHLRGGLPARSRSSAPTAWSPPATAARSTTAPPRW